MAAMRDVFWNKIFEEAKTNRDIVLLSADFSAPSLDKFRLELPSQYINLGIAEQNMMLFATGMALEGKKAFCYAITPFLTMRCFEQTRLYAAGMKLPITLVGVGAGFSYSDSGYTHHALEDISIMRTLPHMRIFQPCDNASVEKMADLILQSETPVYLRLDRYGDENLVGDLTHLEKGLNVVRPVKKITLIASGYMIKTALKTAELLQQQGIEVGILDACILPMDKEFFAEQVKEAEHLIVLEEHVLAGGLGSYILELVSDLKLSVQVHRCGLELTNGYIKEYSSRENIHTLCGIDVDSVVKLVKEIER